MRPIVVVGSYNTGLTMSVERLPRPGETVIGSGYAEGPGGKGSNQAIAARRLGGRVSLVAKVGNDRYGEKAVALFQREGLNIDHVLRSKGHTGLGFVVVDKGGSNSIAIDPGANLELTTEEVISARGLFSDGAIVLLQDEVPVDVVNEACALGRGSGATVILNPAPAVPPENLRLDCIDILTPNEQEFYSMSGTEDISKGSLKLLERGPKAVVVTLGERGARVVTLDDDYVILPPKVTPLDTTGAGDAFNGALAVALSEGEPLRQAVTFANFAGALSVTKREVVPSLPTRAEVDDFRRQYDLE